MFEPSLDSEIPQQAEEIPPEAAEEADRYGGVALGVECAWPIEAR